MTQSKRKAARPKLRFSPTAWAKLLCLRDLGDSEIGGFGITPVSDLLYVGDIALVKQVCTPFAVVFDDAAVADFFDQQIDRGRRPEQFARIWVHTHPGNSPAPSTTDEETFARVFGESAWAVMFILAAGGQTYARLGFHTGPGGALEIPVEVDYSLANRKQLDLAGLMRSRFCVERVEDLSLPAASVLIDELKHDNAPRPSDLVSPEQPGFPQNKTAASAV